ncbi:MAG: hypothetical protein BWX63_02486 [Bacteroidetes bacterium ADurb.Bin041]|nr:MAG: hypothetical protein BWX63_02486 [Bacteroidetes bacterium ADurb.Bin041]
MKPYVQNCTFARSDTQDDTSACKRVKCENQLEHLRYEYNKYRKANNLWKEIKRQSTYEIFDDKLLRIPIVGDPEVFYEKWCIIDDHWAFRLRSTPKAVFAH